MTYKLTIEPIEELVDVADGQTLLDASLRAGVWLPHACGHGLCGTCKVQVLEGVVDHGNASPFALMDLERDEGYTLACSATATSDVVIEADVDEEPDAVSRPVRDFVGTVSRLDHLTADILGIWISVDEPIEFQAGQYINLHVPGVERPRAFSIASSPSSEKEIELHVRLVPGGEATPRLHTELAVGDQVHFSGPYGRFFVRRSAGKPMLFLAGGSGLSSPKSMVIDLLETGCDQPIMLVHGVRTASDVYFAEEFRALEADHANFTYVPVLSEHDATAGEWDGETGYVNEAAERRFDGSFKGISAYLCGPPPMIEACIRSLMKGRLFERDIFTEKFVTAADGEASLARSPLFRRL
ncbi:MAG TPA: 2Fe-2S iron-sulfur cluster binding domain-containing protein [Ilumatobacteraceae bacterium]|nr:2Fe-2S iron-sulfur cluster binding domain-containing protein [Ilumatobacteraceae bacterium]